MRGSYSAGVLAPGKIMHAFRASGKIGIARPNARRACTILMHAPRCGGWAENRTAAG